MAILSAPRAKALVMAAAIAGGLGFAGSAQAAGGCGPGFHPNPWGICRPNWGWGPRPTGVGRSMTAAMAMAARARSTDPMTGPTASTARARSTERSAPIRAAKGVPPAGGTPFAHSYPPPGMRTKNDQPGRLPVS